MKLYFAPGTCSFSPHIALREAGITAELVQVDIKKRRLVADGSDFSAVSPKGYVPVLELGSAQRLQPAVQSRDAGRLQEHRAKEPGQPIRLSRQPSGVAPLPDGRAVHCGRWLPIYRARLVSVGRHRRQGMASACRLQRTRCRPPQRECGTGSRGSAKRWAGGLVIDSDSDDRQPTMHRVQRNQAAN